MIRIHAPSPTDAAHRYGPLRLASQPVSLDQLLAELSLFGSRPLVVPVAAKVYAPPLVPCPLPPWLSRTTGTLDDRTVTITARFDPSAGYAIDLDGGPSFRVTADGRDITLVHPCPIALDDPFLSQVILGPALLLALALHGTFALHASAVAIGGRAAVFLGDSGAGKSTLAAALGSRGGGWQRLADDVLPVALDADDIAVALPEYPQLKLPPEAQYVAGGGRPERVPIAALYLLDMSPDDASAPTTAPTATPITSASAVTCEPITGSQALTTLIAHTIASRLFAPDLAARHFAFCAAVASAVPMKRLSYPRRFDAFDAVAAAVASDLGMAQTG